jgi:hypothetical protein
MSNEMQTEVERLIGVAQSHAWNALARPLAQRESYLVICRDSWKHYATAFNTSPSECDGFADSLQRATRDLMVEIQKNIAVVQDAGGFRMSQDAVRLHPDQPKALTLEELRPIFRQIIESGE